MKNRLDYNMKDRIRRSPISLLKLLLKIIEYPDYFAVGKQDGSRVGNLHHLKMIYPRGEVNKRVRWLANEEVLPYIDLIKEIISI